jgi:hypothetical protein
MMQIGASPNSKRRASLLLKVIGYLHQDFLLAYEYSGDKRLLMPPAGFLRFCEREPGAKVIVERIMELHDRSVKSGMSYRMS